MKLRKQNSSYILHQESYRNDKYFHCNTENVNTSEAYDITSLPANSHDLSEPSLCRCKLVLMTLPNCCMFFANWSSLDMNDNDPRSYKFSCRLHLRINSKTILIILINKRIDDSFLFTLILMSQLKSKTRTFL